MKPLLGIMVLGLGCIDGHFLCNFLVNGTVTVQEVEERDVPVLADGSEHGCFPGLVSQQGMLSCGEQWGVEGLHGWAACCMGCMDRLNGWVA